jgi:hypothetical protein
MTPLSARRHVLLIVTGFGLSAAAACSSGEGTDNAGQGGSATAAGVPGTAGAAAGNAPVAGSNAGGSSGSPAGGAGGAGGASAGASAGLGGTGGNSGGGNGGASTCGTSPPVTFSENIRVNDDTGNGNQAEVTLATGPNGLAIAAWGDSRAQRTCSFSVSKDGGATWGKNVAIVNDGGDFVGDPAAAIDGGGTIYAVCQQYQDDGQIRLMTSTDGGDTWSQVRSIQPSPDKPWAAGGTEKGTLFVSWLGGQSGIKRSLDGGQTFGPIERLGNIIHGTAIATSLGGFVHVPYNLDSDRNQLRYVRSTDGGETWDDARDLIPDMGDFCFNCSPRQHPIVGAATDPSGKIVAITWTSRMPDGEDDDDVWLLYSKDGGDSWTEPIRVNDNQNPSRQFQSWVAVDGCGRVHLVWTDLRNGQNEVWYARSSDPTQGFEPNIQVTDDSGPAKTGFLGDYKGLSIVGSDLLVVWQDTRRDSGDIYASRAAGAASP